MSALCLLVNPLLKTTDRTDKASPEEGSVSFVSTPEDSEEPAEAVHQAEQYL
jgi:hypothetical protein